MWVKAFHYRIAVNGKKRIVGYPATTQKQYAARLQDAGDLSGIFAPERPPDVMKAPAVADQIKIAGVKRRIQSAAFMPVDNDARLTSALLGESEGLSREVEAVDLVVLRGKECRVRSRSAS